MPTVHSTLIALFNTARPTFNGMNAAVIAHDTWHIRRRHGLPIHQLGLLLTQLLLLLTQLLLLFPESFEVLLELLHIHAKVHRLLRVLFPFLLQHLLHIIHFDLHSINLALHLGNGLRDFAQLCLDAIAAAACWCCWCCCWWCGRSLGLGRHAAGC
ncbi:hypothetical protein JKP88DRAFT_235237 [Tribonema minus]|uniref:Uncharacterized protein n=1 Tax=Tribonema minus TaxID=303371 RepID=A0A836CJ56_9STRA|nr:hypothetical protein JKP88DRAFT_235237 [Tribonema minus]